MNASINKLVQSLLQKDSLEQCSVAELQQLAERYPYFSAAHLLLAKKLQGGDPILYKKQLEKTSLYVQNPLWLEHLLNDTGNAEIVETPAQDIIYQANQENLVLQEVSILELPEVNNIENEIQSEGNEPVRESVGQESEQKMITGETNKEPEVVAETPSVKIQRLDPGKMDFLFQPYHTVDYFASQGIKFRDEEQPKDKFGKQLKSFTEWLKTMKRLPVAELASSAGPGAEKKVEQLAEHSLVDREVVTEAMAEVWEKQGNAVRAIEIYSKLSLLDPSKSTYFAAKIEELKKTN